MSDRNKEYIAFYTTPPSIAKQLEEVGFDISQNGREIIPGNPEIGTIISIKQIHNNEENSSKLAFVNPERYTALIRYQKEIYGELARGKIEHVFVEWIQAGQLGEVLQKWAEKMQEYKKDPRIRENMFAQYGWALMYFLEREGVTLHATESREILARVTKYMSKWDGKIPKDLNHERENFAIKEIYKFLQKNPAKKVALVFGSLHDFRDNMDIFGKEKPRQEIVSFNKIAQEYLEGK